MGIQPYRCECRSHASALNLCIYNLAESYVHVKLFMRRPHPRAHLAVLSYGLPGGNLTVYCPAAAGRLSTALGVARTSAFEVRGSYPLRNKAKLQSRGSKAEVRATPSLGLVKSDFIEVQGELPGCACH
jgi:hypothetical protein